MKTSITSLAATWALGLLLHAGGAQAASGDWAVDGPGTWSEAANWSPVAIPGAAADDVVGLAFDLTGGSVVTIDTTNRTVGVLSIGDPAATFFPYTLAASGGASLVFATTGGHAQLNKPAAVNTVDDLISAPLVLNTNLDLANSSAAGGTITLSGPITAGGVGTKTLANVGAGTAGLAISGVIGNGSGTVAVVQNSTGSVLTLSGSNTYSGATTVSAGTLKLQGPAFSTMNRAYSIASGGELNLDGNTSVATSMTIINGAGTLRISGGQLGNGIGSGRSLAMSMSSGGVMVVQSGATIYNGGWQFINWTTNKAGLTVDGLFDIADGQGVIVDALNGSGTFDKSQVAGGSIILNVGVTNGSGVFGGTIKNTQASIAFTKSGAGTQVLAGTNAYTGSTTVNNGTLTLTASRTVAGGAVVVGNGGTATLNIQGNLPFAGNNALQVGSTTTGIVHHSAGTVTFNAGNNLELLIGNGTGVPGHGTYNLSGSGVLNIGAGVANRGIMLGVNSGVSAANPKIAEFNMSGGTVNNANALMIVRGDFATSFFRASFTQTGGNASNQTLVVGGSGANGASSTAALTLTGGTFVATTFSSLSLGNSVTSTITIAGTADVTLGAFPTNRGSGSAADLIFDGGILRPAAASTNYLVGLTSARIRAGGATFDVAGGRDITVKQNLLADLVSTGGGLTKAGSGVLTLTGSHTYQGPTTVNAGTLIESGALTLSSPTVIQGGSLFVQGTSTVAGGTGTITVKTNGTLGGSGLIDLSAVSQDIVVENGGRLSPGPAAGAVGTLTLALGGGSLDLGAATSAGTLVFALGATNASDRIVLNSGTLNIGGGQLNFASFNFQIVPGYSNATSTYTLIQSTNLVGALAGAGLSGTLANGMTATIAHSGHDVVVNLSGVEGVSVQPITWKGNLSGQWDNGSTNWVLTADGVTAAYYADGSAVTFDDSAAGNTNISGSTVMPGSVVVSNTAKAYTLNPVIAGGTAVAKWGTNALTLAGSNTFTGGTTLHAGKLNINVVGEAGVSGPLGNGGTLTIHGGAIDNTSGSAKVVLNANPIAVGGDFAFAGGSSLALPGTVDLGGTNRVLSVNANTLTLGGSISNGGLTKAGGGTLALTTANTYGGGTELVAGTLLTSNDVQLGTGGGITVSGTATWNAGPVIPVTYNRNLTINSNAALGLASGNSGKTITGVLSGSGSISNSSTTGFDFRNTNNTFAGRVNNGYQMSFASLGDSTNAINLVGSNSRFVWTGGARTFALRPFTVNNTFASANNPARIDNSGSGALTILLDLAITGPAGARTLELGGTNASANVFAGAIANGTGAVVSLNKAGSGHWALSGTNTYTGVTTMNFNNPAGSGLTFQGMHALSPSTLLTQTHGGGTGGHGPFRILDDSPNPAPRTGVNLTFNHGNNSQNAISVFVGNNNTANGGNSAGTTVGSTIELGGMTFNQTDPAQTAGTALNVTGANGYKLQIAYVNFSLQAAFANAWPAKLQAVAPLVVTGQVQQLAGNTNSGRVTLQLDGSSTGLISGVIKDSADALPRALSISKLGGGVWTLSASNSFTGGLTLGGATAGSQLNINHAYALGPGPFTISGGNNARIDNTGGAALSNANNNAMSWLNDFNFLGSDDLDLGVGAVTMGGHRVLTISAGTLTVGGPIGGTNLGITKQGAGKLVLTGSNTYSGPTTIRLGILQLGNGAGGGTISDTAAVTNNGTLAFNASGDVSAGYPIAGTGVVTKTGPGAVSLAAASSFSGLTYISNGVLLVDGSISTGAVTVVAGGTLGGTGTVGGTVTSAGVVDPGGSIGQLNVANDYLQAGSLHIEVGGLSHDVLSVSNIASLAGALNVVLTNGYTGVAGDSFTIVRAGLAVVGTFDTTNLPALGGGNSWTVEYLSEAVVLGITNAGGSAPMAGFTATPTNGLAPLEVAFTDTSLNLPTGWAWDFDNNGSVDSTAQHPTNTYAAPGVYAVKLVVTNAFGASTNLQSGCITVTNLPLAGYQAFSNLHALAQGPEGDDDGDGYANLWEYSQGSDPTNSGSVAKLQWFRTNGLAILRFNRATGAVDVIYEVEASYGFTNPALWEVIASNVFGTGWNGDASVTETNGGAVRQVLTEDNDPVSTRRGMRLRIKRP